MKLKSLLFTLLLLTGFSMAKAEIVEIGTSANNATSGYYPVNALYNYSLTQQIYRSYELPNISTISSISFYNVSATTTRNIDIYLKDDNKSSYTDGTNWQVVTSGNLYFSGYVTFVQGEWTTIELDQVFNHDTGKNLIVTMDDNTGTYVNSTYFKVGINTEATKTLYLYSDGSNYDVSQISTYTGNMSNYRNQIRINGGKRPMAFLM